MKTYFGHRTNDGVSVIVDDGQKRRELTHQIRHSPTGLEWGYGGSGPADLALSLLTDVLDDRSEAERLHQDFKRDVVASLPDDRWALSEEGIVDWVHQHDERSRRSD